MNYNNTKMRVLNITHADMDGAACSIILKNFYETVYVVPVTYTTEAFLLDAIKEYDEKYDAIIVTDYYPSKMINELRKKAAVLVLDHHESVEQYNNDTDIIINTLYAGCKLTYNFISKFKDISYLEAFTNLVDDWDMFRLKDPKSPYYNTLYWEMGPKWFMRRFITGNISLYPEEKQYFIDAKNEFNDFYSTLEIFDMARNGVYFEAPRFQYECIEALKKEGYKWFAIKNKSNLSIRCDDVNLVQICEKLGKGGGHIHSVGIPVYKNDDVAKLVKQIEYYIDDYYMNMIDD